MLLKIRNNKEKFTITVHSSTGTIPDNLPEIQSHALAMARETFDKFPEIKLLTLYIKNNEQQSI